MVGRRLRAGLATAGLVLAGTSAVAAEETIASYAPWGDTTSVASLTSTAAPAGTGGQTPAISAHGRYVAFFSSSPDVVPGDSNGATDVFVRDRLAGATQLVSVGFDGGPGDGESRGDSFTKAVSISSNGRFVAFVSSATNLVPGDTNGVRDVFVRDLVRGTTTRVSVGVTGQQANADSDTPSISADGRRVAFESDATNLTGKDNDATSDVFVRDLRAARTRLVSISRTGDLANAPSGQPAISADGRWVAFWSDATNLVRGDRNRFTDVFVRNVASRTTELVSLGPDGQADFYSGGYQPAISAHGERVAFNSGATNLVEGRTLGQDLAYVRDLAADVTYLVSESTTGEEADSFVESVTMSRDGRMVAFWTRACNLIPDKSNCDEADVYVKDLVSGVLKRASVGDQGQQGLDGSYSPALSADGRHLAFISNASLIAGHENEYPPLVYVRDQAGEALR